MSVFDFFAMIVLLSGMASGFARGFTRQAWDFLGLYVGLAVAAQYNALIVPAVNPHIPLLPFYTVSSFVFVVVLSTVYGLVSFVGQTLHRSDGEDMSEFNRIGGFILGAIGGIIFLSVLIPVLRYAMAGSWASWDLVRLFIARAIEKSYLTPFLDKVTPYVLMSLQPLLPAGLPDVLTGKLMRAALVEL